MNLTEELKKLKECLANIRSKISKEEFGTLRLDAPDFYLETFSRPGHLELKMWENLGDSEND